MSPRAVTTRLRRVAQLRRLCLSLARAKRPGTRATERPAGAEAPTEGPPPKPVAR